MFGGKVPTTLEDAFQALQVQFQQQANDWNRSAKHIWMNQFNAFSDALHWDRIPANSQPEPPPLSYVVTYRDRDSGEVTVSAPPAPHTREDLANMDILRIGPPVCNIPEYHPPLRVKQGWFNIG